MTQKLPDPEGTLKNLQGIISYLGPFVTVTYVCSNWREAFLARDMLYDHYPADSSSQWDRLVYPHMLLKFSSVNSEVDWQTDVICFDHNADPRKKYSWNKHKLEKFMSWTAAAHSMNESSDFPHQF